MSLNQSERDYADDLFSSAQFGDAQQKKAALAAIDTWAAQIPERLAYIAELEAADRAVDSNLDALRSRYPRQLDSRSTPVASQPARAVRLSGLWPGVALACCAMAVTALWVINPVQSRQDMSSSIGQQSSLDLDDGSRVLLNTNTAIRFVNRLRSRELTLERGEALFSVKHSALRPFHVYAGTADIRDVGTRFSVRLLDGVSGATSGVSVAVLEGQVSVTSSANAPPTLLSAHEALRTNGTTVVPVTGPEAVSAMLDWTERRLDFDATSISDVIGELQRYRKQPIVLADERAGTFRVSGGFSIADPDQLLKTLPSVAPVTVTMKPDGTAVVASRR
jgi:transmembrane sensor